MSHLRSIATSPTQYDDVGTDWLDEGGRDTPWRVFFTKVLTAALGDLAGQSVLDVGCGTGWLFDVASRLGARQYLGIEPSRRNYQSAVSSYGGASFTNAAFESFSTAQEFDVICCIMSTEHMEDLDRAFARFRELLEPGGRLIVISGDPEAYVTDRFDYAITVEHVSEEESVVQTLRPLGVDTVDIIRAPSLYVEAATTHGFEVDSITPLAAGNDLIELAPQYASFRHKPMFQLMVFTRR